jgi:hypothetical protein
MDVVLDANVYLSDPRMEGISFRSLLDYLRKTQSNLVLPKLVFDEVLARYPERLDMQAKKTIGAVNSLRNLVFETTISKVPDIDTVREVRGLASKLIQPSGYVKAILLKDFSGISVEEVARRGVERVPPASAAGEELRDVITWLMILKHAEEAKQEIAFVTADEDFGGGGVLHPQLVKELVARKVTLYLYRTIDNFIKRHAPTPQAIASEQAFTIIGKQQILDLFETETRALFPSWQGASPFQVLSRDVTFIRGSLYDVGADSQYGEVEFSGELRIRVTRPPVFTTFGQVPPLPLQPMVMGGDPVQGYWCKLYKPEKFASLSSLGLPQGMAESTADFSIFAALIISIRLESGKVTQLATEQFELTDIERASED